MSCGFTCGDGRILQPSAIQKRPNAHTNGRIMQNYDEKKEKSRKMLFNLAKSFDSALPL